MNMNVEDYPELPCSHAGVCRAVLAKSQEVGSSGWHGRLLKGEDGGGGERRRRRRL